MGMRRKAKNRLIKSISIVAIVAGTLFATALDSGTMIPAIVCGLCAVWLLMVCYANIK
jgi:hypothetical protein